MSFQRENIDATKSQENTTPPAEVQRKKTTAELDEKLMLKLEDMSGEGGAAGLEYEDGKPAAMKRSVKNNMFRLI